MDKKELIFNAAVEIYVGFLTSRKLNLIADEGLVKIAVETAERVYDQVYDVSHETK